MQYAAAQVKVTAHFVDFQSAMRFESPRTFSASKAVPEDHCAASAEDLPAEIAFLDAYHVEHQALWAAVQCARRDGGCAARALTVEGGTSAALYYRALAYFLGLPFVDKWPLIVPPRDPTSTYKAEAVRLVEDGPPRWLVAPTGKNLRTVIRARRLGISLAGLSITTPTHLAAIIQHRAQDAVEHAASDGLHLSTPELSAKRIVGGTAYLFACLFVACGFGCLVLPRLLCDVVGLLFLAGIAFRVVVCMAGLAPPPLTARRVRNDDLPYYTVLVPLHHEGAIVPNLVANLRAIDYPLSKLEILILVEPEDTMTRQALAATRLPPHFRVVIGPSHKVLRTKPRALNIGLMMARGAILTVYDAEDCPEPDQLRRAAALFAEMPETVACVQARLAMGNGDDGLLAKLFAIEYAALFDVYNGGTAALRLPLALGGTSNHFRVSSLRAVGGWDAWNVTEDADLGLRFARLGYDVAALDSTTMEAAPTNIAVWLNQRRRWTKGWMQTALVLARDAPCLLRQLGWKRSFAVMLMLVNLVAGPLLLPIFCGLMAYELSTVGLPQPHATIGRLETALDVSVLLSGIAATLWPGYAGLRARGLGRFRVCLPLMLPYQLMISLAAWLGLWDLVNKPFHWHKTPH